MSGRIPGKNHPNRRQMYRRRLADFWLEVKARRAGRKGLVNPIGRAARDVTGPTGWVWSNAWDELERHGGAYIDSFDRRLPPSIFVSERDRTRHRQPMPTSERCIEDYRSRLAFDELIRESHDPAEPRAESGFDDSSN